MWNRRVINRKTPKGIWWRVWRCLLLWCAPWRKSRGSWCRWSTGSRRQRRRGQRGSSQSWSWKWLSWRGNDARWSIFLTQRTTCICYRSGVVAEAATTTKHVVLVKNPLFNLFLGSEVSSSLFHVGYEILLRHCLPFWHVPGRCQESGGWARTSASGILEKVCLSRSVLVKTTLVDLGPIVDSWMINWLNWLTVSLMSQRSYHCAHQGSQSIGFSQVTLSQ